MFIVAFIALHLYSAGKGTTKSEKWKMKNYLVLEPNGNNT